MLSSQKSRLDALKVFADLQQKYPDALSNKVPDVQEKDLSERGLGTMFRLVVGPPGSRSAASGVCSQLKSAGSRGLLGDGVTERSDPGAHARQVDRCAQRMVLSPPCRSTAYNH